MESLSSKYEVNELINSKIIKTDEIEELLDKWLPKKPSKILKLYDTDIDSVCSGAFHKKCDNKGETIVLVQTDLMRFGGYTSQSWNYKLGSYISDKEAFIFSLNKKKKYPVIIPEQAIYSHITYGPTFGPGHDFYLSSFCTTNQESYCCGTLFPVEDKYALNNGTKNFRVVRYEVYQLVYKDIINK